MAEEIRGSLLVASPILRDPNFTKTVVLLVDHQASGSLGFVINRRCRLSFSEIVAELKLAHKEVLPAIPVLEGGPVAPYTGWLVFRDDGKSRASEAELQVGDHIRISRSTEHLAQVADTSHVAHHLLILGYAGWGPGQLDAELKAGIWIPVDLDDEVIFDTELEDRWQTALSKLGIDPSMIVGPPMLA